MRIFFRHYSAEPEPLSLAAGSAEQGGGAAEKEVATDSHLKDMEDLIAVLCDEEAVTNA